MDYSGRIALDWHESPYSLAYYKFYLRGFKITDGILHTIFSIHVVNLHISLHEISKRVLNFGWLKSCLRDKSTHILTASYCFARGDKIIVGTILKKLLIIAWLPNCGFRCQQLVSIDFMHRRIFDARAMQSYDEFCLQIFIEYHKKVNHD